MAGFTGGIFSAGCQGRGFLGLGKMGASIGVARATGGVPVPVCNVASNFTLEGYRYGNKTDALGTPIGIAPVIETKKDPKGISQWGTKPTYYVSRRVPVGIGGYFPAGLTLIIQVKSRFVNRKPTTF